MMAFTAHVDEAACIGSGQCELFCPQVFQIRDGIAIVVDPTPDEALHDKVLDAADACPVQAIVVRNAPDDSDEAAGGLATP